MSWGKIEFNGEDSDACNFTVITGLAEFSNGKDTFLAFCREHLVKGKSKFKQKLYSHYVFGGPSKSGGNNLSSYAFAPEFAKYLTKHKLGAVQSSPEADNPKWHAGRLCQTFIWTPDLDAVSDFYDKLTTPKGD